jgi:apolipoprotein D and lipocalin family protein
MEPVAVERLDLERYVGSWYEIARYPNRFEKKCARDVMAHYALTGKPGRITVRNECRRADGRMTVANGYGKVDGGGGRLKVSFFRPFWAKYWVLALDTEYRWSLVGEPKREYLWILSRTPELSAEVLAEIKARATALGFDAGKLTMTAQGSR